MFSLWKTASDFTGIIHRPPVYLSLPHDFMHGKCLNAFKRCFSSKSIMSLCLPFLLSSGKKRRRKSRTVWSSFCGRATGKSSCSTHLRFNFSAHCSSLSVTFLTDSVTQSLHFLLKLQIILSATKELAMIFISQLHVSSQLLPSQWALKNTEVFLLSWDNTDQGRFEKQAKIDVAFH